MADPILPDGADWTIDAMATAVGIDLVLVLRLDGKPTGVTLELDRQEARHFGRLLMAAAGDGTERTFVEGGVDADRR